MTQYIDKSKIVTEIERRLWLLVPKVTFYQQRMELEKLLSFIDTLETKDVDLKKEFYDFLDTLTGKDNGHLSEDELFRIVEYFYELGLNTQKGE